MYPKNEYEDLIKNNLENLKLKNFKTFVYSESRSLNR